MRLNPWILLLRLHAGRPHLDVSKIKVIDLTYPDFERSLIEVTSPRKEITGHSEFSYLRVRTGPGADSGNTYYGCPADFSNLLIKDIRIDRHSGQIRIYTDRSK